jgi:hypothetical protein
MGGWSFSVNMNRVVVRVSTGIAVCFGITSLVVSSDGTNIVEFMFVLFGVLTITGFALLNGIAVLALRKRKQNARSFTLFAAFAVHTLVVVVMLADVVFNIGFRIRFNMSRAAFETAAHEVRSGKRIATPTSIGYYRVSDIDVTDRSVRFIIGEFGLADGFGVVYSPEGTPSVLGEDSYWAIGGPWWLWIRYW